MGRILNKPIIPKAEPMFIGIQKSYKESLNDLFQPVLEVEPDKH